MIFGITHLVMPVTDLGLAENFYGAALSLTPEEKQPQWLEYSNGFIRLRLELSAKPVQNLSLWIETQQIEKACDHLLAAGARLVQACHQTQEKKLARLQDPFGHELILWRNLSEDELEVPPPLPKALIWAPEAENILQILLKEVPAHFRNSARKASVLEAEYLAGSTPVTTEQAIIGCIRSAPLFMRAVLKAPLTRCGINWEQYQNEFEPSEDEMD